MLLAYFGETLPKPCGNCDICSDPPKTWDATVAAQKMLSAAIRTGNRFGAAHLIDVLTGHDTDKVRQFGHDGLPTFGIGKDLSEPAWRNVARQLVALGWLLPDDEGFGGLKAGESARSLLKGEVGLQLRELAEPKPKSSRKDRSQTVAGDLPPDAQRRFDALRLLRLSLAQKQQVPPYVIFNDATLREMAVCDPASMMELLEISGVGEQKLARYGQLFLDRLTEVRDLPSGEGHGFAEPERAGKVDNGGGDTGTAGEGLDRAEIAQRRGLSEDTIAGHLLKLFQADKIGKRDLLYVSEGEVGEIVSAARELGLKPGQPASRELKETLGNRFSYGDLNAALWVAA